MILNALTGKGAPKIGLPTPPSKEGKGAPRMGLYRPPPVIGTLGNQVGMGKKKNNQKKRKEKVYCKDQTAHSIKFH